MFRSAVSDAAYQRRSDECFDPVVCADGYRSLGRTIVTPDYRDLVAWRGILPETAVEVADLADAMWRVMFPGGYAASYGGKDRALRGTADRLEAELTDAGVDHDVKEYHDAGHGFLNDHHAAGTRRPFCSPSWGS